MRRILLFTGAGAIAGLLASAISTPFYTSRVSPSLQEIMQSQLIDARKLVTFGTTYGLVRDIAFGALVAAVIAFLLASREPAERRLARAGIAALVGAVLYTAIDMGIEKLFLSIVHARHGSYTAPIHSVSLLQMAFEPMWGFLLPASLALSVLIAHAFKRYYRGLALWASLIGGFAGMGARTVVSLLFGAFFIGKLLSSKGTPDMDLTPGVWAEMTALMVANGAGVGLGFAFAIMIHKAAWLKSIKGLTEGRTWSLQRPLVRIGCHEANEVFLPPDGTLGEIHAQVQSQDEAHFIVDVVGDTTLNGQHMQSAWLKDGDRIGVGSTTLVYRTRLDSQNHPSQTPNIELPKTAPAPNYTPNSPAAASQQGIPTSQTAPLRLVSDAGHEFPLRDGTQTVGRDPSCDIALTWEPSVSRRHAEITVSGGQITVVDIGSTNGTYVNGVPITVPTQVLPGAQISFGKCQMNLR
ncbi:MAG: FHA domain-containing protein [Fimbriimonadaceae bacterium]|nr:FHA domain-containing protein [Fimbriimonadaceae bacterium]